MTGDWIGMGKSGEAEKRICEIRKGMMRLGGRGEVSARKEGRRGE